jgi:hypothetical protein
MRYSFGVIAPDDLIFALDGYPLHSGSHYRLWF